jgi:hypothetical protein
MRTADSLCIHPELCHPQHERGVFEVEGHCGGWREWLAYDSKGTIRIQVGLHDHDYDDGLEGRMEARLRQMEIADEEGQEA